MAWKQSNTEYKTIKTGIWSDKKIWYMRCYDGSWHSAPKPPSYNNDVYIESGHTVTLIKNESCRNLNYINGEDKTSVDTSLFTLNIYGGLRRYSGTAPGTTATTGSGIGTSQWLIGNYTFKGNSRILPTVGYPSSFNLYGSVFTVDLDDNDKILELYTDLSGGTAYTLGGSLTIKNGNTLKNTNCQLRVAQTRANLSNTDGTITIESGAVFNYYNTNGGSLGVDRSASTAIQSFTVNSGGRFEVSGNNLSRIAAATHVLNGDVYLSYNGDQSFPLGNIFTTTNNIDTFSNLYLINSGIKTLVNNITVNSLLSLSGTASLSLSTFSLTYGVNCDLEYKNNYTKGFELPSGGTGSAIPRNLIIPTGVTLDLGGATVNIRGILQGGGNITNGTLNQNQI